MFQKIKNEFNRDFVLTSMFEKICCIFGCLTFPLVLGYIWIKLIAAGTSTLYSVLKSFGFFTI